MTNIEIVENFDGIEQVIIDNGDETFTSMSKAEYDRQQAEIAFRRMKTQVTDVNFFQSNETKLLLTLPTGSRIEFKSGEKPDNLYGDDVFAAVIDEASRMREESWYAMRSTLTATQGKCKLIGNVKGKKNWFYKLGERARSGESDYRYFKITAYDAVKAGILKLEEVEQAKRDLPENVFNELYLAEGRLNRHVRRVGDQIQRRIDVRHQHGSYGDLCMRPSSHQAHRIL